MPDHDAAEALVKSVLRLFGNIGRTVEPERLVDFAVIEVAVFVKLVAEAGIVVPIGVVVGRSCIERQTEVKLFLGHTGKLQLFRKLNRLFGG